MCLVQHNRPPCTKSCLGMQPMAEISANQPGVNMYNWLVMYDRGAGKRFCQPSPIFKLMGNFLPFPKLSYRSVGQTVQKLRLIVIWIPFWPLSTLKTVIFVKLNVFLSLKLPSVKLSETSFPPWVDLNL